MRFLTIKSKYKYTVFILRKEVQKNTEGVTFSMEELVKASVRSDI